MKTKKIIDEVLKEHPILLNNILVDYDIKYPDKKKELEFLLKLALQKQHEQMIKLIDELFEGGYSANLHIIKGECIDEKYCDKIRKKVREDLKTKIGKLE